MKLNSYFLHTHNYYKIYTYIQWRKHYNIPQDWAKYHEEFHQEFIGKVESCYFKKKKSRNGPEGSNTVFSATSNFKEHNITQILIGTESRAGSIHTVDHKSNGPNAKLDHFKEVGEPTSLIHDNSNMQISTQWKEYMRRYWVKDQFIELYHPNQNPIEWGMTSRKMAVSILW